MDFRISRLAQPRTVEVTRGINVCKERDYTKDVVAWPEGETTVQLQLKSDASFLKTLRDKIFPDVYGLRYQIGTGANYAPMYDVLGDWTNYALASGIVSQMGRAVEAKPIPQNIVRICWFGNITDADGDYSLNTIRNRWNDFAVGSLLKRDSIEFGDVVLELEENEFSEEYRDLHLTYVDIDVSTGVVNVYFADDRSINLPWYGYIPPCFGGKPSALGKVASFEKIKATIEPYGVKRIRKMKMEEIVFIESKYEISCNTVYYFDYLKDLGRIVGVKE